MGIERETGATATAPGFGARLRAERERAGIGVRELSRRLDVSASMISQIERERVMPSVNTLYSITSALGISLDELFGAAPAVAASRAVDELAPPFPRGPGFMRRRADQQSLFLDSGVRWDLLTSEPNAAVEFLRVVYDVGSESTPANALMRHSGHEYGTVVDGALGVTVGFETHQLEAGDSISFDSSTPHRLFNAGDVPAVAVWVVVGRGGDPRNAEPH